MSNPNEIITAEAVNIRANLSLVPITLAEAKSFVGHYHRHNDPPLTWKFGVGLESNGKLVGVAMAGLPKARHLMKRFTLEINRTCTDGTRNANSMLYGAIARAARALGYRNLYTYTLESESGSSLRACGWNPEKTVNHDVRGWERSGSPPLCDLFGRERLPQGPKIRWTLDL